MNQSVVDPALVRQTAAALRHANRILIITGAGLSADSGLPTYRGVGGHNGHFDYPVGEDNGWSTWAPQLGAMSGDLVAYVR